MENRKFPKVFYGIPYSQEDELNAEKSLKELPSFSDDQISFERQKSIFRNMKELMTKHFFLVSNKRHPIKHKLTWLFLCILLGGILCTIAFLVSEYYKLEATISYIFILLGIFKVFDQGTYNFSGLAKDLVKQNVAQMKGWIYDYKPSYGKATYLNSQYPRVFAGDIIVGVDDEFIGLKKVEAKEYFFKSGIYTFKVQRGNGKKKKYVTKHSHYIIVSLKKKLNVEFLLTPEIASGFFSKFSRKELQLESQEFNKLFKFEYQGKRSEKEAEIIKNLSPAVQLGLIDLVKRKSNFKILFSKDTLVFSFSGKLINHLNTKAYRYSGVDPKDIQLIDKEISEIIDFSVAITKYLD